MTFDLFRFSRNRPLFGAMPEPSGNIVPQGFIEDGAVDTAQLDPNATIRNLINGPATVTINSTGITIEDGALILKDEFGTTVMVASGFSGSWSDFIGTGLYNGLFASGVVGAVPNGRTVSLPYWTVTLTNASGTATLLRTADANYPGGYSVRFRPGGMSDKVVFVSDKVSVIGNQRYIVDIVSAYDPTGINPDHNAYVDWYDSSGALLSTTGSGLWGVSTVLTAPSRTATGYGSVNVAPANARSARVRLEVFENGSHSANTKYYLGAIGFRVDSESSGSSFPLYPSNSDRFYRTDLGMLFEFGGTTWKSVQLFTMQMNDRVGGITNTTGLAATTSTFTRNSLPFPTGITDIYLVDQVGEFFVNGGTALSASHKWVVDIVTTSAAGAGVSTPVLTTIASGASTVMRRFLTPLNFLVGSTAFSIAESATKTGTPGNLLWLSYVTYRMVAV